MELNKLDEYIGNLKLVRIERHFAEDYITGFVHGKSDTLLIMQQFHDFYYEGYAIIRLSDIVGFRSKKYERFFEQMLEKEGLLCQVKSDYSLPLNSIKETLSFFITTDILLIVECESSGNAEDDEFYIGKPIDIENSSLWFREFNGLGKWEQTEVEISINDITKIQFETPYIQIFSKYVSFD